MDKGKRNKGAIGWLLATVVVLSAYVLTTTHLARDIWRGWQYNEPAEVNEVRVEIGLTDTAKRVFLATMPALETAEDFNEHCKNQREEVSLLGCYTDGKMYIYDVQSEELSDVKKVTAAHELLHAVWARMSRREQEEVTAMLEKFESENEEWVKAELEYYDDGEKMEELYTRAATKVRDLPEDLEGHYKKYFVNRLKLVEFYENYQAPFEELRAKCLDLKEKTDILGEEIMNERGSYEREYESLRRKVENFNQCAETMGCFESEESFLTQRRALEAEGVRLQSVRDRLNGRIDEYNEMVTEYEKYRTELGELNDSMNSQINKVKEGEL